MTDSTPMSHTNALVPVTVFPDAEALGRTLASEVADGIVRAGRDGRRFILGCPGGRTPRSTFQALAAEVGHRRIDLGHLVVAMMDEYVEPGRNGEFRLVEPSAHYSCRRFGREEIVDALNAAATGTLIPSENLWLPDAARPAEYDDRLKDAGGVDLFIIASGASDGHVGFNPSGTPASTRTRLIELAETTRRDNLSTFPDFGSIDDVPRHGVTVGADTISALSRRLVLVLIGVEKRLAFQRVIAARGYQPDWPATVVLACSLSEASAAIYVDQAVAGTGRPGAATPAGAATPSPAAPSAAARGSGVGR